MLNGFILGATVIIIVSITAAIHDQRKSEKRLFNILEKTKLWAEDVKPRKTRK